MADTDSQTNNPSCQFRIPKKWIISPGGPVSTKTSQEDHNNEKSPSRVGWRLSAFWLGEAFNRRLNREWSSKTVRGWQSSINVGTGLLKSICHKPLEIGCSNPCQFWRSFRGVIRQIMVSVLQAGAGFFPGFCNFLSSLRAPHVECFFRKSTLSSWEIWKP